MQLGVSILFFDDQALEIVWVALCLHTFRHSTQELVEYIFVFRASFQVIGELRVQLIAQVDQVSVLRINLMHFNEEVVHVLQNFLLVSFDSLSLSFPMLPHFKFGLEVGKLLLDKLRVHDACQAFLVFAV